MGRQGEEWTSNLARIVEERRRGIERKGEGRRGNLICGKKKKGKERRGEEVTESRRSDVRKKRRTKGIPQ